MNVNQHVALNQFFHIYRLVSPILALPMMSMASNSAIGWIAIGLIVFLYILPLLLTRLVPTECIRIGCTGCMQETSERLTFWRENLVFTCDHCDTVHQVKIFNPNIQVTAEFSS